MKLLLEPGTEQEFQNTLRFLQELELKDATWRVKGDFQNHVIICELVNPENLAPKWRTLTERDILHRRGMWLHYQLGAFYHIIP